MHMTEDELNRIVESKLEARLAARIQADRERVRAEVIAELRREEDRRWYDRVNRKHPIEDKYGGLGPEGHAARLKEMDARAREDMASMDRSNARVPEGSLQHQRRASIGPGSEGFEIRSGRRS
jgi:hypothetical protein